MSFYQKLLGRAGLVPLKHHPGIVASLDDRGCGTRAPADVRRGLRAAGTEKGVHGSDRMAMVTRGNWLPSVNAPAAPQMQQTKTSHTFIIASQRTWCPCMSGGRPSGRQLRSGCANVHAVGKRKERNGQPPRRHSNRSLVRPESSIFTFSVGTDDRSACESRGRSVMDTLWGRHPRYQSGLRSANYKSSIAPPMSLLEPSSDAQAA